MANKQNQTVKKSSKKSTVTSKRPPGPSPLKATPPKVLKKQAQSTMRRVYKPAFKELGREEKRLESLSNKRKADNAYYLDWLNKQSQQLTAHEDAARTELIGAQQQAGREIEDGYNSLRDHLVSTGEQTPGVISDPGDANAFDVSNQAQRDRELVGAERQKTMDQLRSREGMASVMQANNFATVAAAEARRTADRWEGLSKIAGAKDNLRLTRAADTAKEVARLLDREIQKAQIRGEQRASATSAALEAKRFGLDAKKLGLEAEEFDYEKEYDNRNFKLKGAELGEDKRWHDIQAKLKGKKNHQEKAEANHQVTTIIQEGISLIAQKKNWQKLLGTKKGKQKLALILGGPDFLGSPLAAQTAVELVATGKITGSQQKNWKQIGYVPPPKWR